MEGNGVTARDIDSAAWAANPFVARATERLSLVTRGTYLRILKLPITADRAICLDRHLLYSREKYTGVEGSAFAAALDQPGPELLRGGIVFNGSATHWHYLVDGLGTLRGLSGLGPRTIYVDAAVSGDQIEFLVAFARAAGLDECPAVVRLTGEIFRFADCVFPCRSGITDAVSWVRTVLRVSDPPLEGGAERIFVARGASGVRRLVNEDEVRALLERRYGFETVDPAMLTLEQQRQAFRSARVIVGPHGSGLANAMFAHAPAAIVELYHSTLQRFFGTLSKILGARYVTVRGDAVAPAGDGGQRRPDNADFRVDPEAVVAALARLPQPR